MILFWFLCAINIFLKIFFLKNKIISNDKQCINKNLNFYFLKLPVKLNFNEYLISNEINKPTCLLNFCIILLSKFIFLNISINKIIFTKRYKPIVNKLFFFINSYFFNSLTTNEMYFYKNFKKHYKIKIKNRKKISYNFWVNVNPITGTDIDIDSDNDNDDDNDILEKEFNFNLPITLSTNLPFKPKYFNSKNLVTLKKLRSNSLIDSFFIFNYKKVNTNILTNTIKIYKLKHPFNTDKIKSIICYKTDKTNKRVYKFKIKKLRLVISKKKVKFLRGVNNFFIKKNEINKINFYLPSVYSFILFKKILDLNFFKKSKKRMTSKLNYKNKINRFKKIFISFVLINDFYRIKDVNILSNKFFLNNFNLLSNSLLFDRKIILSDKNSNKRHPIYYYNNFYPVFMISKNNSSKIFSKFKFSDNITYLNYMQQVALNFLEIFFRKKLFLRVTNNHFNSYSGFFSISKIFSEYRNFQPKYMKKYLISDFLELL